MGRYHKHRRFTDDLDGREWLMMLGLLLFVYVIPMALWGWAVYGHPMCGFAECSIAGGR